MAGVGVLGAVTQHPLLGSTGQLVFGAFVIIVGAVLLFGRRTPSPAGIETKTDSLTTSAYGSAGQTPERIPVIHRSAASISVRVGFAVAIMCLQFNSLQNFWILLMTGGLVIAAALAVREKHNRRILVPVAAIFLTVAVLAASTGHQIDKLWVAYGPNGGSPHYSKDRFQYRYVGSVRKYNPSDYPANVYGNVNEAFVAGETIVHVQAPDNNKVVFDGRMTAGEIDVSYVDNNDKVLTDVSSQSGLWTTKHQTYGTGPKELHVAVHGGVGRLVLEIDRSEYVGPVCYPSPGQPAGSYYCK